MNQQPGNLYLLPVSHGSRSYSITPMDELEGRGSQMQRLKRSKETKKGSVVPSATDVAERIENSRRKKEKKEEKNVEEKVKFCRPGDYVIIVQDVTSPPFLDAVLQPAYVHVKVISRQKRAKSKDRR